MALKELPPEMKAVPFDQQRPEAFTRLIYPTKDAIRFSGQLVYENPTTGERLRVPNIWYNQPKSCLIAAYYFYAEQSEREALRLLRLERPGLRQEIEGHKKRASQQRAQAALLESEHCPITH